MTQEFYGKVGYDRVDFKAFAETACAFCVSLVS